ncbi:RNA polymerase sigma-70 factor, ECF subfamily [Sporobacter termitidis DSM 10068]|uniref:RNA polymerase sigma-70 factor, ECF subfamily n=1 Tax=Sporobacter termitidis DSM 10068 TaxID=1123282 RepID=A0A1M5YDX6_9FIRM|nr:sigma-70 family RNA polymerase sigma factor [Sporobacter termitidis]SHI10058.1 RNA polymerase sigma-70 factor, ECF subfamily [Sporobacter termitidis DSM 10068]
MDIDEFGKRVTAAEKTLYHISKSILRDDASCADAVQETIVTALEKRHTLKNERYFKTWLCRILINECYKMRRADKRLISLEEYMEPAARGPEQEESIIYDAIMRLKEELRLAVVLHYIDGFRTAEVADILKLPEGTVKSRLHRARAELKALLNDNEEVCNE